MLCSFCNNKPRAFNKTGKQLKFCSADCKSNHIIRKRSETNLQKYGSTNPMKSAEVLEKRNQTNLQRYGVTNPFSLKQIQQKQQATCQQRFGVPFATQSIEIQDKIKQAWIKYPNNHPFSDPVVRAKRTETLVTRYGVEHPILDSNINEKIKQTCLKLYGFENAAKSKIISDKISESDSDPDTQSKKRQTSIDRYGVEHANQRTIKDQLELLDNVQWLEHNITELGQVGVAELLAVSVDTVRKYVAKYQIVLPKIGSDFERQVLAFVQDHYSSQILVNDRKTIGKELDIFLPDLKIAFECNGTYWHSELNGKTRSYHLNKLTAGIDNNIELMHIWEHEWNNKRPIIQSRIKSKLKLNSKIGARKCTVKLISKQSSDQFLKENHIQGSCASSIRLGLFDTEDTLVAVMTFGASRFAKNTDWELLRFCNANNITVVGGASKLFQYFLKMHPMDSIISYADRSFNTGGMYGQLGFTYSHSSAPAYYYTRDYKSIANRVKFQKHKLKAVLTNFDNTLSEWDNMKNNGYDRIWDCGTTAWIYTP